MKRWEWLAVHVNRNNWKFGAEIGVKDGKTTCYLLGHCPGLHMVAVDPWEPQPESGDFGYLDWPHEDHEIQFRMRASKYGTRIGIIKATSIEASGLMGDRAFDFVFLDGDHSYEAVKADIEAWLPKVREGGMICGHDESHRTVRAALAELLPGYHRANHDRCWFWQIPITH